MIFFRFPGERSEKRWPINRLLNRPFITHIGDGNKERQIFVDMAGNKKGMPLSQLMAKS